MEHLKAKRFQKKTAKLELVENTYTKTAEIKSLYSEKKKQGHAAEVMTWVCDYADQNFLTLMAVIEKDPLRDADALSNDQLVKFFRKFHFIQSDDLQPVVMKRPVFVLKGQ